MKNVETKKLGTFLGVFTPTILTILGVIMYMRAGWVAGHMGLVNTLLIVLIANSITLITTLSFSSVATNKKVGAGGAYYIISRTLGFAIGGAIGVPLFLSQVFSITLYSYGLAEVLNFLIPWIPVAPVAFVIIIIVAALSFKGADFALKTQIPIMAAVAISLLFLAIGAFLKTDISSVRMSSPTGEVTFFTAFAIFFPAVTGIMAGLGLSGDLKDPQRSIPLGAITATLVGFAVYLTVPFLLVMGADDKDLINDVMVWSEIAPAGALFIIPGLFGAIFSSAVGSMLGEDRE
ncbi:MAG TPA: Na-K-Cl cotransporter, partial [bacterium]|nr:Na-K-Cl cotransporter [bacterium]